MILIRKQRVSKMFRPGGWEFADSFTGFEEADHLSREEIESNIGTAIALIVAPTLLTLLLLWMAVS